MEMKDTDKRKRGRPRAVIDEKQVFEMVLAETPRKTIAKCFNVSLDTLLVRCRDVIAEAREIVYKRRNRFS